MIDGSPIGLAPQWLNCNVSDHWNRRWRRGKDGIALSSTEHPGQRNVIDSLLLDSHRCCYARLLGLAPQLRRDTKGTVTG
jgi:hypothetical protein